MINIITKLIFIFFINILFGLGSYDILNIVSDARSLSLNNINSKIFLYDKKRIPLSYTKYSYLSLPANIHLGNIQYVTINNDLVHGIKFSILNYGKIVDGKTLKTINPIDAIIEYGYNKKLNKILTIGFGTGYLFSSISEYNSHLFYSNIGIQSKIIKNKLELEVAVNNIGYILKSYTDFLEPIPTNINLEGYYQLKYMPATINFNIVNELNYNYINFSLGIEFLLNHFVKLRLGINNNRNGYLTDDFKSDFLSGISFGMGLKFKKTNIDLGFFNFGANGLITGLTIKKSL